MKAFKRNKKVDLLQKNMRRVIVVSPLLWIFINVLFLGMAYLLLPDEMYISKPGMMFAIALIINGWFFAGLLLTYLFRDGSHKFISVNLSTSLGMDDGFAGYIPPQKIGSSMIEPQYTCRILGGFMSRLYGIHTQGRTLAFYPTEHEMFFPGGGYAVNCQMSATLIAQLPAAIRLWIKKQGGSFNIYREGTEVYFARLPYYTHPTERQKYEINLDLALQERDLRIDGLESRIKEQEMQIALMTQERTQWILSTMRGSNADLDKNNKTSQEIHDQTQYGWDDRQH
jgi:hypothetical protein